ncbi:hypothetical protein [Edaphobacter aggregans]|uniref:hypothetical protein n=1 Tax=Edaphobacter aggregans TaxID=570835 RepID=UPI0005527411|nr:hypothetical protein [Edaphobacter aggregans]
MNELYRALGDINCIRKQMASATEFRGYGPATLATTSAFAVLAAFVQQRFVSDAASHRSAYLVIWISTAALCCALTGAQMFTRSRRIHSALSDEMIRMAVEQFLPSLGAGLLLTLVLTHYVPHSAWMLPGMWQIVFSLGIFSSCRFLPRPMIAAGTWYLLTGLACIAIGGPRALSPWAMGVPYGVGQLLVAAILLFSTLEAPDEA